MSSLPKAVSGVCRCKLLFLEKPEARVLGRKDEFFAGRSQLTPEAGCCRHVASPSSQNILPVRRIACAVEASASEETEMQTRTRLGARERRAKKIQEERKRREKDETYPEWASILESACKDDKELREIVGDSIGDPEEMKRRVEERVRRKGKDILQSKTGSAMPMEVTFRDFNPLNDHVWLELYSAPSDHNIDIIGSVFRSWYVLGRLGSFNSMNMQLTKLPIDQRLSYSTDAANEALPAFFHNVGDLEFQDNLARIWVDLGTSDPVALDVLISGLTTVSSDYVGIKRLVFGGKRLGDWEENMTSVEDGYRSFKI